MVEHGLNYQYGSSAPLGEVPKCSVGEGGKTTNIISVAIPPSSCFAGHFPQRGQESLWVVLWFYYRVRNLGFVSLPNISSVRAQTNASSLSGLSPDERPFLPKSHSWSSRALRALNWLTWLTLDCS